MAKNIVPTDTYKTETLSGVIATAIRAAKGEKVTANEGAVFRVPAENLNILPNFNVRVRNPTYDREVEDIKTSIRVEGFMKTRPLTVFAAKEDGGDKLYILDGHRRHEAVMALLSEGIEIGALPVIMAPSSMTLEDHLVSLATSNAGAPLTFFEKSLLAKRLENMGIEKPRISERLNVTDRHLHNMLVLSGAPTAIRNLIIDNKIEATEALKQMKKKGLLATDAIQKGVARAEAKGKRKATAKDIDVDETPQNGAGANGAGAPEAAPAPAPAFAVDDGKIRNIVEVEFKKGTTVPKDEMLPFGHFANGDWFNWVDKHKKHAFIEHSIAFTVSYVMDNPNPAPVPDATDGHDDTFDPAPTVTAEGGEPTGDAPDAEATGEGEATEGDAPALDSYGEPTGDAPAGDEPTGDAPPATVGDPDEL